jgi:hypothetical protein
MFPGDSLASYLLSWETYGCPSATTKHLTPCDESSRSSSFCIRSTARVHRTEAGGKSLTLLEFGHDPLLFSVGLASLRWHAV